MPYNNVSSGTVIASRAIHASAQARFDPWADRLDHSAREASGYLDGLRLGQTQGLQHLVFRFSTDADARGWRDGPDFHRLASEADGFSVGLDQVGSGDPVRFELPSDASAAKWKRFATTWVAVFPVLLAISSMMRWLLEEWPPALQLVPSSLMLTATLQCIIFALHPAVEPILAASGCERQLAHGLTGHTVAKPNFSIPYKSLADRGASTGAGFGGRGSTRK